MKKKIALYEYSLILLLVSLFFDLVVLGFYDASTGFYIVAGSITLLLMVLTLTFYLIEAKKIFNKIKK
ncbi:MAG: hypothetical protein JST58_15775 [Bacteroidetes bacterium]|nr:hypothetical protein [Bacteroidota bacterium]